VVLRVRTKVWIEGSDGAVVMSEYRAGLLDAVDRHRSVAAAARAVGLPYRTAWKKLQEMERAAGVGLLASEAGGTGGGQTELTDAARDMLAAYRRLSKPAEAAADTGFERERAHFEVQ
jgi:molybdate transport system regulatory protein